MRNGHGLKDDDDGGEEDDGDDDEDGDGGGKESGGGGKGQTTLQHATYGIYVAERLGCVRSRKKVLCLKAKIDQLLHEALLEELSD
jgi:hypothetical protein